MLSSAVAALSAAVDVQVGNSAEDGLQPFCHINSQWKQNSLPATFQSHFFLAILGLETSSRGTDEVKNICVKERVHLYRGWPSSGFLSYTYFKDVLP